jgi:hypothetical protein
MMKKLNLRCILPNAADKSTLPDVSLRQATHIGKLIGFPAKQRRMLVRMASIRMPFLFYRMDSWLTH